MQHVVTHAKRGMLKATLAATGFAVALAAASTGAVATAGSYHDSYTTGGQYRSSGSYTNYRWVYDSQRHCWVLMGYNSSRHCWDRVSTYNVSRYGNQQSGYSDGSYRYR